MMVLNSAAGGDTSTSLSSRAMIVKGHQTRRRRASKGTIAGFAFGQSRGEQPATTSQSNTDSNGDPSAAPSDHTGSGGGASSNRQGNQPQHAGDSSSNLGKPCHSARLALLCCQNAIRMGARTQLGLCPPGRARRGLKAALRQRTMRSIRPGSAGRNSGQPTADVGGYFGVDKMIGPDVLEDYLAREEDFLVGSNTFDADSDEEASSGDDDDLVKVEDLLQENAPGLDDEKKYLTLREPLFTPIGAENALANGAGGSMIATGGGTGKLPFNRRKLRYFDSVTADDKMTSRRYLQTETQRSKQREHMLLSRHLRRMQRQERRRIRRERGEILPDDELSDQEDDDVRERALLPSEVSRFDSPMTPSIAAALVIESLSLNKIESIEGMAKCYEGIVAAGVALLESAAASEQASMSGENTDSVVGNRSKIMAALTPLLITSLEQPSGEVILSLARLRRMCGTTRYQRRFVQRIAPSLIRPPRGAMWCLRHQNDMEPILAAAELIFDSASEIFSKGWYDRGQLLLADSKRAETLNSAADQLRNLSSGPSDNLTLGGFAGHGNWRARKGGPMKDSMASNEPLAEWEVIAVDRQIRISISNIISMDWSRVVVHSRDSEASTRSYHRSRAATKRSSSIDRPQSASGDMSPKPTVPAPMSPARPSGAKTPLSPAGPIPKSSPSQPEPNENSNFTANFGSDAFPNRSSNTPSSSMGTNHPLSPPAPNRSGADGSEGKLPGDHFPPATNLFPPAGHTPPRSPTTTPKSPKRDLSDTPPAVPSFSTVTAQAPLSPKRPKNTPQVKESISNPPPTVVTTHLNTQLGGEKDRAPLSPSSVGTSGSPAEAPYRASSMVSVASSLTGTGTQPAHYRMLTSTAAERKRTVAACRALRAQITRFEDAFIQLHGRAPKGAAERAPLATTYAQYREWKRAIRADAACRIQALFRGARARWILLRSNEPRIARVILTRAGRRSFSVNNNRVQHTHQDSMLNHLQIPQEIGDSDRESLDGTGSLGGGSSDGYPTQHSQGTTGQSLPPHFARRRPGEASGSPVPRPVSSPGGSVTSIGSSENFARLSLSDLQARKRDLKQQLKQYDMNFARRHGRMPVKAEKEPIRHLYEKYNSLKSQITQMEQEGRSSPVATPQQTVLSQRTVSPGSERSEDSGGRASSLRMSTSASTSSAPSRETSTNAPADLTSLRTEKGRLHQMLRAYERDFFREHQRQVSSFADIRPVAAQYRRYKEIKKQIASLQGGGRSGNS